MRAASRVACVEIVGRVAGTGCRCIGRAPARVLRQPVLLGLAHRVRIAAGFHRQVGPVGDGEVEHIGRPPEPAHAGHRLTRGRARADFRAGVRERDAPVRCELDLGESGLGAQCRSVAGCSRTRPRNISRDARRRTPACAPRGRSTAHAPAPSPARPRRVACRAGSRLGCSSFRSCNTLRRRNSIGIEAEFAGDLVDHQLGRRQGFQRAVAACRRRNRWRAMQSRSRRCRLLGK